MAATGFLYGQPLPEIIDKECVYGDCENGKSTATYSDGAKYTGEFRNGLPHGMGVQTFDDGGRSPGTAGLVAIRLPSASELNRVTRDRDG